MQQDAPKDSEVEGWLKTLGIDSLCQWDVLIFLDRHQTSLVGAEHLARLLGYSTELLVDALDVLVSLGLVGRSRVSQGARLYRFTPPSGSPHGEAFRRLLDLASHRAGRLVLSQQLRKGEQTPSEGPDTDQKNGSRSAGGGHVMDHEGQPLSNGANLIPGPFYAAR
ncbi:MAG: MarR family transcriptional regulator, partial [Planctomycetaceae bacterium]|nr:MarR family transcriptional regulator [Planctomycetaceae bacterium]